MKKTLFVLLSAALTATILCGHTSCKNPVKVADSVVVDSDTAAAPADTLPATLADAPAPKGKLSTWLVAGFDEDGYSSMFIVDGDESRLTQDREGGSDTLQILRLVSYVQTEDKEEPSEEGGTFHSFGGRLTVDAFDPKTRLFLGRYRGSYDGGCEYDAEGELLHGGESYSGTFTAADGTRTKFSFHGD